MTHSLPRPIRRVLRHGRRATALGLIAALVVISSGIAVHVPVQRMVSELFPCMDCACGCVTAEMCWQDCCCYTDEQKIAWAELHGVIPPASLLAEVDQPACCQKQVASCCSSKQSCCEKEPTEEVTESEANLAEQEAHEPEQRRSTPIVFWRALRCQGLSIGWTLLPPTVVPPANRLADSLAGPTERVEIRTESFSGELPPPELPPPQNLA